MRQAWNRIPSNVGGLGSFGAHGLVPDAIGDVIDEIRSMTSKPFAVTSFIFGIPSRSVLDECRAKDIVTIGAATPVDEAARC